MAIVLYNRASFNCVRLILGYKMKKRIGFVSKLFQQVFSGFAHEHSGEMLSSVGKHQILSADLISTTVKNNTSEPLNNK